MRDFILSIVFTLFILGAGSALPDDKPITLTEKQQAEWNQFAQVETQLQQGLQGIVGQSAGLSVNCQNSMQVHSGLKEILIGLELNRTCRDKWLAEIRLEHNCPKCVIEGGKLVRPESEKAPQK